MQMAATNLLKTFILKTCSSRGQHWLRRNYSVYKLNHGIYDREREMALLQSLVRQGDHVADVGANVGVYTKELSLAVGPAGKVYSFEPVSENYDILTTFLARAHLDNVHPFHAALGSCLSECEMIIPEMDGFTGFYWAHLSRGGEQGRRQAVEVMTLDHLFNSGIVTGLDFIKCDVEGGELEVLRGSVGLIWACHPAWLMEVSRDSSGEVFSLLHELGYEAYVYADHLVRVESYRDREFFNYFFLHPGSKRQASGLILDQLPKG
jgi:FkbM family methyltransferase